MESEGTVAELDFNIFEEVCRQMEQWHEEKENLIVSCNFARITIGRKDFVRRVREIADRYTFCREKLVMEITEDAMEMDKGIAFSNILHCKEMGFLVALAHNLDMKVLGEGAETQGQLEKKVLSKKSVYFEN